VAMHIGRRKRRTVLDVIICVLVFFYGCEWLYGTYFGHFWGFMADHEAVAMGQVFPVG